MVGKCGASDYNQCIVKELKKWGGVLRYDEEHDRLWIEDESLFDGDIKLNNADMLIKAGYDTSYANRIADFRYE